ncbi:MAG: hypothetical protein ABSC94_17710 [Polyangiaceae bacterium]
MPRPEDEALSSEELSSEALVPTGLFGDRADRLARPRSGRSLATDMGADDSRTTAAC